jgi:hypothetical protein
MNIRTLILAVPLAMGAVILPLGTARAEDTPAQNLPALLAEIDKARDGRTAEEVKGAADRVVEMHNASTDAGERGKIQSALGGLLKSKKAGSARSTAAEALGRLNDPTGAWKALKHGVPSAKQAEVAPFELRAIESVGQLVAQAAVGDLVKLMRKGRSRAAVSAAIQALGCYGSAGEVRVKVLKDMLAAGASWKRAADAAEKKLAKAKPAKPSKDPEKEAKPRKPKKSDEKLHAAVAAWKAYAPMLVESLNKLTGKTYATAEEWLEVLEDKKTTPDELFAAG